MVIRLLYFASLRERLGVESEALDLPAETTTVADLLDHLRARGDTWAEALDRDRSILVAINQEMARAVDPVADGDEVGIFPPVTGG